MAEYRFLTTWLVDAPRERAWEAIEDAVSWPEWWRGVVRVDQRSAGHGGGRAQRARLLAPVRAGRRDRRRVRLERHHLEALDEPAGPPSAAGVRVQPRRGDALGRRGPGPAAGRAAAGGGLTSDAARRQGAERLELHPELRDQLVARDRLHEHVEAPFVVLDLAERPLVETTATTRAPCRCLRAHHGARPRRPRDRGSPSRTRGWRPRADGP